MKTQQEILLSQLKLGSVNSYFATYTLRIKQAPTRIKELREQGYSIISTPNKDRSVDWHLNSPVVKKAEVPHNDYVFIGNDAVLKEEPRQGVFI